MEIGNSHIITTRHQINVTRAIVKITSGIFALRIVPCQSIRSLLIKPTRAFAVTVVYLIKSTRLIAS